VVKSVDTSTDLLTQFEYHQKSLIEINKLLRSELKNVQELKKKFKQHTKKSRRKKSSSGKKSTNSGIMKKLKVPKVLATFMGSNAVSRVDVLKKVSSYVKDNVLQDPDDKRYIDLDDTLELVFPKLVDKTGDDRLCFTSIMTHISHYFPKKGEPGYDDVIVEKEVENPEDEDDADQA